METASADVARVLFGFATEFHYLFVAVSIGLMGVVTVMDGTAWWSRQLAWAQAGLYWGRFFVLAFVCGVATGWPLRYHLAQQWGPLLDLAGPVVRVVFEFEGLLAPWLFGLVMLFVLRRRLPLGARVCVSAALGLALCLQSVAILALNAWMQAPQPVADPVGLWGLLAHPLLGAKLLHTLAGAYVAGAALVISLSAWLMLSGRELALARVGLRLAAPLCALAVLVSAAAGHRSGELLIEHQPAKFAAIEALWEPSPHAAPLVLWAWPDAEQRHNRQAFEVPGLLSELAGASLPSLREVEQRTAQGVRQAWQRQREGALLDAREHALLSLLPALPAGAAALPEPAVTAAARRSLPPVVTVFWSFRVMVGAALLLLLALSLALSLLHPRRSGRWRRWWLRAALAALPLAWLANAAGWMVCEVGRQPWMVTGLLTTAAGHSGAPAAHSALLLLVSSLAYALVALTCVLLTRVWLRNAPVWAYGVIPLLRERELSGSEKRRIVAAALATGVRLEDVALHHGVAADRLRRWVWQLHCAGCLPEPPACPA